LNIVLAAAVVMGSAFLVERLGLPAHVSTVLDRARRCRRILTDSTRSDMQKERVLREEAVRLFGLFGRLAGGSVLAIGVPLALIGTLDVVGVVSAGGVIATLVRPAFLATVLGLGALVYVWRARAGR
jgi:hypothetical protein